jgi:hypothetical protein
VKELPLACSLGAADLRVRAERWRALGRKALVASGRDGAVVRLTFSRSAGVEEELRELVRLEGGCCAFLDMTVEDGDGELTLLVAGPAGAEAVVDGFLELPATAA